MGVVHFHVVNPATVAELSAALRKEGCLIQHDCIAVFLSFGRQPLLTGQNGRCKFLHVAVFII